MTSRRALSVVLIGATVVCVGGCDSCEVSHVKANAKVQLNGSVAAPNGGPARGVRISLLERPDAGEVLGGLAVGFATLGIVCAVDSPPTICREARTTTTGDDGRFTYRLRGSDTQGSVGNAGTLDVTAAAPGPGAAATTASFRVQHQRLTLPALRLWDAALKLDVVTLTPHWRSLPGSAVGGSSDTTIVFADADGATGAGGTPVWEQAHARSGVRFDARVLEDAAVDARVSTESSIDRRRASYALHYLSAEVHISGSAGAPVSRGAACLTPRGHRVSGLSGAPCWLTDGDLAHGEPAQVKRHSVAVIDLGRRRRIALIVVRGEPAIRTISISSDGRSFRALGTRRGAFEQLAPQGARGRYVALQTAGGIDATAELSVWG